MIQSSQVIPIFIFLIILVTVEPQGQQFGGQPPNQQQNNGQQPNQQGQYNNQPPNQQGGPPPGQMGGQQPGMGQQGQMGGQNQGQQGQNPGMGGQQGQNPGMGGQQGQQPGMGGQQEQNPGMGGQQGQNPGMGGQQGQQPGTGQQGGQQPGITQQTTTRATPIDPGGVPVTQTRSQTETTTTTIFSADRPALSVTGKPYAPKDECVNFKVSSLPTNCCDLPKLEVPENVTKLCHKICKEAKSGSHCCWSQCKFREMKIYNAGYFNATPIVIYLERSIKNRSDASLIPWSKAILASISYCLYDQQSKDTTRPPIPLTTDRMKYLMNNAIQNGQGHYVNPEQQRPPQPVYTAPPGTTESLAVRQNKNIYCGIPVFVFRIVACMRVMNFYNCPFFNGNSTVCVEKREQIRKCGNELNYTI